MKDSNEYPENQVILMNTHTIYFYGELKKINLSLLQTPAVCLFLRDFINHLSIGPGPVIFGLISTVAGPPDQLIFMFVAKR